MGSINLLLKCVYTKVVSVGNGVYIDVMIVEKVSNKVQLIVIKAGNNKMFLTIWEKAIKIKCIPRENLVSKRCLLKCTCGYSGGMR